MVKIGKLIGRRSSQPIPYSENKIKDRLQLSETEVKMEAQVEMQLQRWGPV